MWRLNHLDAKSKVYVLFLGVLLVVAIAPCALLAIVQADRNIAFESGQTMRMAHALATASSGDSGHSVAASELLQQAKREWPGVIYSGVVRDGLFGVPPSVRQTVLESQHSRQLAQTFSREIQTVAIPIVVEGKKEPEEATYVLSRRTTENSIVSQGFLVGIFPGLLLACVIAAFAAFLLRSFLFKQSLPLSEEMVKGSLFRKAFRLSAELSIAVISVFVSVGGFVVLAENAETAGLRQISERELAILDTLRNDLRQHYSVKDVVPLSKLEKLSTSADFHRELSLVAVSNPTKGVVIGQLMEQLNIQFDYLMYRHNKLDDAQDARVSMMSYALALAAGLAILSLLLMRISAIQQRNLEEARENGETHFQAYRQLTDNLPIGLYLYSGGAVSYTNETWKRQHQVKAEEPPEDAWARLLHAHDRDDCITKLWEAESFARPFEIDFKLVGEAGQIHHMQTQGVPIIGEDGQVQHLLGFTADVTTKVLSALELDKKHAEVEAKNDQLQIALSQLEDNVEAVVHAMVRAVEAKDPYTAGHSERVMGYAVRIGHLLGLSPLELKILEMGTLVHDIGKIGIPDVILTKPGSLTPEEFAIVAEHPAIGAKVLSGVPMFRECIPIILDHHERLDGSGYPNGLKGDEISPMVRIASVADSFDAMTSTRAYRVGMAASTAISILRTEAASGKFDSEIVELLADIVNSDGILWNASSHVQRAA